MNTVQTIIEVLEINGNSQRVVTDVNSPRSVWVKTKHIQDGKVLAPVLDAPKPELDEFWKSVVNANGMDVCTPFINRFPTHSFVAYDNGLVWSPSMQIGFNTNQGRTISRNECPKSMTAMYSVGSDLSSLK